MSPPEKVNIYDNKQFTSVSNSTTGEVSSQTRFHYHQTGHIVWGEYSGGSISRGHLIATVNTDHSLDMRYHHVNVQGVLMTGKCRSTLEVLADGRLRLHEVWEWTCGDFSKGESIVEEEKEELRLE